MQQPVFACCVRARVCGTEMTGLGEGWHEAIRDLPPQRLGMEAVWAEETAPATQRRSEPGP